MKRPAQSDEWRLDLILKHKAVSGPRRPEGVLGGPGWLPWPAVTPP